MRKLPVPLNRPIPINTQRGAVVLVVDVEEEDLVVFPLAFRRRHFRYSNISELHTIYTNAVPWFKYCAYLSPNVSNKITTRTLSATDNATNKINAYQYHLPVKYGSDELLERIGGSNAVETVVVTVVVTIILEKIVFVFCSSIHSSKIKDER